VDRAFTSSECFTLPVVLLALRQMKASTGRIPDYQPSGTSV
jgi:hypothetical protein